MLQLPNGCRCSGKGPAVSPKNWKTATRTKGPWRIHYRFYPASGPSKPVKVMGMNDVHDLEERRKITAQLLANELQMLKDGYNPILKKTVPQIQVAVVHDEVYLIPALRIALGKLKLVPQTIKNIARIINVCERAAQILGFDIIEIKNIRRMHMKAILEQCRLLQKNFTDNTYNHYRNHLMIVFNELLEMEAIESHPIRDIKKLHVERPERETMTQKQREFVNELLHQRHPSFHRFLHIFFNSGCRITELLAIRVRDVNLARQAFRMVIKKGRTQKTVWRTINDAALPLWETAIAGGTFDDFVFSSGLVPGTVQIASAQITRRWKRHVKDGKDENGKGYGITADFYSLKHTHTTEVIDMFGADIDKGRETAARINGHTSTAMVDKVYDIKARQRRHEKDRKINVPFAKKTN